MEPWRQRRFLNILMVELELIVIEFLQMELEVGFQKSKIGNTRIYSMEQNQIELKVCS